MAFEHLSYAYECNRALSTVAAYTLHILAHQIGKNECCWPSYEYIGKKLRKSARTAYTACQELVAAGLLYIESGKERGGSNSFYMLIPEDFHRKFTRKYKDHPKSWDAHWEDNRRHVDNLRLMNRVGSPLPTPLGSPLQTGVGNPAPTLGKIPQEGMKPTSDNIDDRTEKVEEQDMFPALSPAPAKGPPRQNAYLPPIGSDLFRKKVREIAKSLGAPESIALRIYEHNTVTKWAVLKEKTLILAMKIAVWYWMQRDPAVFAAEKIRKFILEHPEIVNSAKPEIS